MTVVPGSDPRDYRVEPYLWASQLLPMGVSIDQAIADGVMRFQPPADSRRLEKTRMAGDALTQAANPFMKVLADPGATEAEQVLAMISLSKVMSSAGSP